MDTNPAFEKLVQIELAKMREEMGMLPPLEADLSNPTRELFPPEKPKFPNLDYDGKSAYNNQNHYSPASQPPQSMNFRGNYNMTPPASLAHYSPNVNRQSQDVGASRNVYVPEANSRRKYSLGPSILPDLGSGESRGVGAQPTAHRGVHEPQAPYVGIENSRRSSKYDYHGSSLPMPDVAQPSKQQKIGLGGLEIVKTSADAKAAYAQELQRQMQEFQERKRQEQRKNEEEDAKLMRYWQQNPSSIPTQKSTGGRGMPSAPPNPTPYSQPAPSAYPPPPLTTVQSPSLSRTPPRAHPSSYSSSYSPLAPISAPASNYPPSTTGAGYPSSPSDPYGSPRSRTRPIAAHLDAQAVKDAVQQGESFQRVRSITRGIVDSEDEAAFLAKQREKALRAHELAEQVQERERIRAEQRRREQEEARKEEERLEKERKELWERQQQEIQRDKKNPSAAAVGAGDSGVPTGGGLSDMNTGIGLSGNSNGSLSKQSMSNAPSLNLNPDEIDKSLPTSAQRLLKIRAMANHGKGNRQIGSFSSNYPSQMGNGLVNSSVYDAAPSFSSPSNSGARAPITSGASYYSAADLDSPANPCSRPASLGMDAKDPYSSNYPPSQYPPDYTSDYAPQGPSNRPLPHDGDLLSRYSASSSSFHNPMQSLMHLLPQAASGIPSGLSSVPPISSPPLIAPNSGGAANVAGVDPLSLAILLAAATGNVQTLQVLLQQAQSQPKAQLQSIASAAPYLPDIQSITGVIEPPHTASSNPLSPQLQSIMQNIPAPMRPSILSLSQMPPASLVPHLSPLVPKLQRAEAEGRSISPSPMSHMPSMAPASPPTPTPPSHATASPSASSPALGSFFQPNAGMHPSSASSAPSYPHPPHSHPIYDNLEWVGAARPLTAQPEDPALRSRADPRTSSLTRSLTNSRSMANSQQAMAELAQVGTEAPSEVPSAPAMPATFAYLSEMPLKGPEKSLESSTLWVFLEQLHASVKASTANVRGNPSDTTAPSVYGSASVHSVPGAAPSAVSGAPPVISRWEDLNDTINDTLFDASFLASHPQTRSLSLPAAASPSAPFPPASPPFSPPPRPLPIQNSLQAALSNPPPRPLPPIASRASPSALGTHHTPVTNPAVLAARILRKAGVIVPGALDTSPGTSEAAGDAGTGIAGVGSAAYSLGMSTDAGDAGDLDLDATAISQVSSITELSHSQARTHPHLDLADDLESHHTGLASSSPPLSGVVSRQISPSLVTGIHDPWGSLRHSDPLPATAPVPANASAAPTAPATATESPAYSAHPSLAIERAGFPPGFPPSQRIHSARTDIGPSHTGPALSDNPDAASPAFRSAPPSRARSTSRTRNSRSRAESRTSRRASVAAVDASANELHGEPHAWANASTSSVTSAPGGKARKSKAERKLRRDSNPDLSAAEGFETPKQGSGSLLDPDFPPAFSASPSVAQAIAQAERELQREHAYKERLRSREGARGVRRPSVLSNDSAWDKVSADLYSVDVQGGSSVVSAIGYGYGGTGSSSYGNNGYGNNGYGQGLSPDLSPQVHSPQSAHGSVGGENSGLGKKSPPPGGLASDEPQHAHVSPTQAHPQAQRRPSVPPLGIAFGPPRTANSNTPGASASGIPDRGGSLSPQWTGSDGGGTPYASDHAGAGLTGFAAFGATEDLTPIQPRNFGSSVTSLSAPASPTWGLADEDVELHKRRLLAFYAVHNPKNAKKENVDTTWHIFGPRIWDELERRHPGKTAGFRPVPVLPRPGTGSGFLVSPSVSGSTASLVRVATPMNRIPSISSSVMTSKNSVNNLQNSSPPGRTDPLTKEGKEASHTDLDQGLQPVPVPSMQPEMDSLSEIPAASVTSSTRANKNTNNELKPSSAGQAAVATSVTIMAEHPEPAFVPQTLRTSSQRSTDSPVQQPIPQDSLEFQSPYQPQSQTQPSPFPVHAADSLDQSKVRPETPSTPGSPALLFARNPHTNIDATPGANTAVSDALTLSTLDDSTVGPSPVTSDAAPSGSSSAIVNKIPPQTTATGATQNMSGFHLPRNAVSQLPPKTPPKHTYVRDSLHLPEPLPFSPEPPGPPMVPFSPSSPIAISPVTPVAHE